MRNELGSKDRREKGDKTCKNENAAKLGAFSLKPMITNN